ncbi:4-hydroxy-tetrahydrodipicolinate synthase [Lentzea atacamensis]|uniref:4-hydroxy-tetrahydrodipicolinate synthase n=1 Tax=Lentzea atacamensis TaxID=531938 RepID=A0ABX9E9V9_9PSEU|nr:dihydrodipicolinate synthase family protein [Lentzea atacamensis]RAS66941.1 4-hydroxy-tetrahydrodipicolinate synthase [Lentzea atacamensis]
MRRENLGGVLAAAVVPYVMDVRAPAGLRVDLDRFERHCTWLVRNGCTGVLVNSFALGESGSLTYAEQREVTRAAVRAIGSRATVVAAVHDVGAHQVVERIGQAAEDGADAVLCMPPLSYEPSHAEIVLHYEAVAAAGLPVLVCNNPAGCRVDLSPAILAELSALDNVVGICDFSGDVTRIWKTLALAPGTAVITGGDTIVVDSLLSGACGWIGALPNVFPEQAVQLADLLASGLLVEAEALRCALDGPLRWYKRPAVVQMVKFAMDYCGLYGGPYRPPRHGLAAKMLSQVRHEVRSAVKWLTPG